MTDNYWYVKTQGDPLGAIRQSIHQLWVQNGIQTMLIPANGMASDLQNPAIINDPHHLDDFNPFKPVMKSNLAKWIPGTIIENSGEVIAAVLRPCEMRALVEMAELDGFILNDLITISFDCLGTMPTEDYIWRIKSKKTSDRMKEESIQFARQGGILSYRNRAACQICASPQAHAADVNFNIIGLPVRQYLLVSAPDKQRTIQIHIDQLVDGKALPNQVAQHTKITNKIAERNRHNFERIVNGLEEILPDDIDSLINQLESCGNCQSCFEICPICDVFRPQKNEYGRFEREDIIFWLTACSGCGICEPLCQRHLPLNTIFQYIRRELADDLLL